MATIGPNLIPSGFKSGIPGVDKGVGKVYSGERWGSMTPDREHAVTEGSDTYALVRSAMSSAVGLLNVAEAAGLAIMHAMSAWELSVTLLDGDHYWDIVDVSVEPSRGTRFPDHRYPLTDFPIGSSMLLAGRGYVGGEAIDEVLVEYQRQWPDVPAGSIMSAPIIALGGVHGELFLVRDTQTSPFTHDDLSVVSDCATLLGVRLPALVASYREGRPAGGEAGTMDQLSQNLDALLEGRTRD